jgi:multidrug resistance protein
VDPTVPTFAHLSDGHLSALVIAPLSELYGRNPIYHVSNLTFVVFTIACAVSSNLNMLIGFRFLAGTAGSTAITIGSASIADMFVAQERGAALAMWGVGGLLGPVVGPIVGGYLSASLGWRWTFWLINILAGTASIATLVVLKETYAPVILRHKARKLGKETGRTLRPKAVETDLSPTQFMVRSLVRPLRMLILSPIVLVMSLYMAVVYG